MADPGPQLSTPTTARPLLAFGPTEVIKIPPKDPDGPRTLFRPPRVPPLDQQGRRLAPQFAALQQALTTSSSVTDTAEASDPEHIVVLEVVGTIAGFVRVTEGIEGLNFVADLVGDGFEPDEDFYYVADDGDIAGDLLPQTLYLVMANARAIDELVRLFDLYQDAEGHITFEKGLNPLKDVFKLLHTLRRWGPQDRVAETGLLEHWQESLAVRGSSGRERVEVELVWAATDEARAATQARVEAVLAAIPNAKVLTATVQPAIQYHALLVELPPTEIDQILRHGPESVELLRTEEVLFLAPAVPMVIAAGAAEPALVSVSPTLPHGDPQVALLDGLPLANHDVLRGRLIVHDPVDRGRTYTPTQCGHGTAMASLIIHGDLNAPGPALSTPLYAEPVLEPHDFYKDRETTPPGELFVDVVHAAIERLVGGKYPTAPSVRLVNLSIGEPARAFTRRMSPLARLIDYLSHTYNIVFIVSAGNHTPTPEGEIGPSLSAPRDAVDDPTSLDAQLRRSLHHQSRLRRLLAPAESINAVTVGATNDDQASTDLPDSSLEPISRGAVAPYSPTGFGFRRSPKPELHSPGGRYVALRPIPGAGRSEVVLERAETAATGPGILVAAPTRTPGTSGALYTFGTSNAAALTTHHAARALETLTALEAADGDWPYPDRDLHPVLVKTLLVHATSWPPQAAQWAADLGADGNRRRRVLTQHLGFGVLDPDRLATATTNRATIIAAERLTNGKRRAFRFPLPPSLSSYVGWRRLTITLAWLSPIVPRTQQYRVAHLEFNSPRQRLRLQTIDADRHANGNGTVLHEVLEGERAAGYTANDELTIDVDCRVRVGRLHQPVTFGLAATLEVAANVGIDLHQEIHQRLRQQVRAQRVRTTAQA